MEMAGTLGRRYFPHARYFVGGKGRRQQPKVEEQQNQPAPRGRSLSRERISGSRHVSQESRAKGEVIGKGRLSSRHREASNGVDGHLSSRHHREASNGVDGTDEPLEARNAILKPGPGHVHPVRGGSSVGRRGSVVAPGSRTSIVHIRDLSPSSKVHELKCMYDGVNSEKIAMNNILRSELKAHQELKDREDNILEELRECGVDIARLDMVSLWLIDPGLPGVEESTSANESIDGGYPGSRGRSSCTGSRSVSPVYLRGKSSSNDSRVKAARSKKSRVHSPSRSGSRQGGRTRHSELPPREELVPARATRERRKSLETRPARSPRSRNA